MKLERYKASTLVYDEGTIVPYNIKTGKLENIDRISMFEMSKNTRKSKGKKSY